VGSAHPETVPSPALVDVVILAGGAGTRLGGHDGPKPLAQIGGRPLLAHVMAQFQAAGFRRFVVALGHGAPVIRQCFAEHDLRSELSLDVSLVDTGTDTGTAGRVARLGPRLSSTFMVANADGLSTVDFAGMLAFHADHGRLASVAAVRPAPRFGYLTIDGARRVTAFAEKSPTAAGWINGGYWVLSRAALQEIEGDGDGLEQEFAPQLAADGELMAYLHDGFWECVDTPHDLEALQAQWDAGNAPWRVN
jgi:glucose-1-phosphate cytidylyltransferase